MKQFIVLGLGVALLAGYLGYTGLDSKEVQSSTKSVQVVEQDHDKTVQEIQISEDKKEVNYNGVVGETALETLKLLTAVETEESSFGEFVTTINGVEADSSSEYWAFSINGELAAIGAGNYNSEEGDKITWQLETL